MKRTNVKSEGVTLVSSLKAEINAEARATLKSDTSRPFKKPIQGRIAVKSSTTWGMR